MEGAGEILKKSGAGLTGFFAPGEKAAQSLDNWTQIAVCFHGPRPGPGHNSFLFWKDHARKEKGSHSGGFKQENDNVICTSLLLFSFCGGRRRGPIMETPHRRLCCPRN